LHFQLECRKGKIRVCKKRERIELSEIQQIFSHSYIPRKAADELMAAKNEEIAWLKEEIRYLRRKTEQIPEQTKHSPIRY
jgi:hypothetical protein